MKTRRLKARVGALVTGIFVMAVSLPTGLAAATPAADGHFGSVTGGSVRVVPCPTSFALANPDLPVLPRMLQVLHSPASVRGLVAYTNTWNYVIGPAGMNCSGGIGANGSSGLTVWPRGTLKPGHYSRTDGLSFEQEPACTSCMADLACPFLTIFPSSYYSCTAGVPQGERVVHVSSHVALFEDPPGVAGSGSPSGGPHPANGYVEIGRGPSASRATCTLPPSQRWICTVSLNDAIARYR